VKGNPSVLEISPVRYRVELPSDQVTKLIGGELRYGATRSAPQLVELQQSPVQSMLVEMGRFVVD
jgi:hypothetical protein